MDIIRVRLWVVKACKNHIAVYLPSDTLPLPNHITHAAFLAFGTVLFSQASCLASSKYNTKNQSLWPASHNNEFLLPPQCWQMPTNSNIITSYQSWGWAIAMTGHLTWQKWTPDYGLAVSRHLKCSLARFWNMSDTPVHCLPKTQRYCNTNSLSVALFHSEIKQIQNHCHTWIVILHTEEWNRVIVLPRLA